MVDRKRKIEMASGAQLMVKTILELRLYLEMVNSQGMTSGVTPNPWQSNYRAAAEQLRALRQEAGAAEVPPYAQPIRADMISLGGRLARIADLFDAAVKVEAPAIEGTIMSSCKTAEEQAQAIAAAIGRLIDDGAQSYGGGSLALMYLEAPLSSLAR